jgi:hypothetical protein
MTTPSGSRTITIGDVVGQSGSFLDGGTFYHHFWLESTETTTNAWRKEQPELYSGRWSGPWSLDWDTIALDPGDYVIQVYLEHTYDMGATWVFGGTAGQADQTLQY